MVAPPLPPPPPPPPPPPTTPGDVLLQDDFARTERSLGEAWQPLSGAWLTDGRGISDRDGGNLASTRVTCFDCRVEARVVGFGVRETALFLRGQGAGAQDRYEVVLRSNGAVQIRRWSGGSLATLAESASGIDVRDYATLSLQATGRSPVQLTAYVNGRALLTATDTGALALGQGGSAGLWTTHAGVVFDDFKLVTSK